MKDTEAQFMALASTITSANPDIIPGKMMSSPGLKYKDKVFAFYYKETMGFRLGPEFNPEEFGLSGARPLSPFKFKPPLKGWYLVDRYESNSWETLASMALKYTMSLDSG
jgi:hypothetical protein